MNGLDKYMEKNFVVKITIFGSKRGTQFIVKINICSKNYKIIVIILVNG